MLLRRKNQNVAVVGINRETAAILALLLDAEEVSVLRILNPAIEELAELRKLPGLDIIINTSDDPAVLQKLRRCAPTGADIIGSLSARILFLPESRGVSTDNWSGDRGRVLRSLHEVKQAVLLSKNKEELLKLLLHVAISTCKADSGSIMLVDAKKRFLKIEMADGLNLDVVQSATIKYGKGVAGKVARTGKALLISGQAHTNSEKIDPQRPELVSSICCPLVIGSEVVGVLNINSKRKDRTFDEDDLKYVKDLSQFTADVIKTSKEFEVTSTSTFSMSLVQGVQEILNMKYPLQERFNLLVMKVVNTFGGVICNYYRYIDDSHMFLVHASSSFNIDLLKGKSIKLNDSIATKVIESGKTVSLNVPDKKSTQKKWYIAQPVTASGRLRGLLFLHLVSDKAELDEECRVMAKVGAAVSSELDKLDEKRLLEIQSTKLVAVSEASFNIASATALRELVNFSLPNACLIMEAEAGLFWLLNPATEQLELFSSFTIDDQSRLDELQRLDASIFDRTLPGDDAFLVRDLVKDGYASDEGAPKSLLSKSFGKEGRVEAVLSLYGKKSLDLFGSRSFTIQDKEVFLKFCLQFSKGLAKLMPCFDPRR
jgi:putative methionine-R-sulfoxide reductase with GAF domain